MKICYNWPECQQGMTSSFLSVSFCLQAVFGACLLLVGDILNGPLFLISGCFAIHSINAQTRMISAGLLYLFTIMVFFAITLTGTIQGVEYIEAADPDNLHDVYAIWISTSIFIMICEVGFGALTLILFRRHYMNIDHKIPAFQVKVMEKSVIMA